MFYIVTELIKEIRGKVKPSFYLGKTQVLLNFEHTCNPPASFPCIAPINQKSWKYNINKKSKEVFLNSANNGNKRRNLMRIKILYYEVYLPLHTLEEQKLFLESKLYTKFQGPNLFFNSFTKPIQFFIEPNEKRRNFRGRRCFFIAEGFPKK